MHPHRKARWSHRHEEMDAGEAFVHDFRHGFVPATDDDVEAFGEEFVASATSNEPILELEQEEPRLGDVGMVAFDVDEDELDVDWL
jgi:hypothetical protein